MHLIVRYCGAEYEVTVDCPPAATIGMLVEKWTGSAPDRVHVDGRRIEGSLPVAEAALATGSIVDIGGQEEPCRSSPAPAGVFNRPPRLVRKQSPLAVELPAVPAEPSRPSRFGWGALVVPLVLGAAMALLVHPRMAMFAIFSPAMLLANWMEDRRRHRRELRENGEGQEKALRRLADDVAAANTRAREECRLTVIDPATFVARARSAHPRLWERRVEHDDFMELAVGIGCMPWCPEPKGVPTRGAQAVLDRFGELHAVPIEVRWTPGEVVGIAGPRAQRLATTRQLVLQAAINHGPSDLAISIFTEHAADWDWAKWLPHVVADAAGRRRLAGSAEETAAVAAMLPEDDSATSRTRHLTVVDLPDLVTGERSALRDRLRNGEVLGIAGITLADAVESLPAATTTVLSTAGEASSILFRDGECRVIDPWTVPMGAARQAARALARLDDPESDMAGCGLPTEVHLASLLALDHKLDQRLMRNWAGGSNGLETPLGVGEAGSVAIDLVADGPHALLGGTTGSGKSELLRTLVAGLAAWHSPTHLNFVLVDYKGGSAFDACGALPHTVGVVTDLDEHLAERALTCLAAELRYREARLRDAGISDIAELPADVDNPLPRLVVVIDEFAALAKELPDFLEALVGIAQRGRSLGVHLVLATQRPAGVITDAIRANTNLRIALRMQDVADSVDVVGSAGAAQIGRSQPGRAVARLGPDDTVVFQAAIVTGYSLEAGPGPVRSEPFVFATEQPGAPHDLATGTGPSDLEQIVATAARVAAKLDLPPVRLPWPAPLADKYWLADVGTGDGSGTVYGLADEPHRQRQVGAEWSPAAGNLLLYGLPGSGTTTCLAALAVGLCRDHDPNRMHIYVLDFDDQHLGPLRDLPHVGAVVSGSDRERQVRLLRQLADELQRRREAVAADPDALSDSPVVITMLDNYGAFAAAFDSPGEASIPDVIARLIADGPGVGMFSIVSAKQPGDVPARLASLVGAKLGFRLADRYEYTSLGIPAVHPPTTPGRAFETGTGLEIQVALPHRRGLEAAVAEVGWDAPRQVPWTVDVLPAEVKVDRFIEAGRIGGGEWFLPLGIGDRTLAPAGLLLREGEHALVTGPPRSGKSTALATIAAVARTACSSVHISAVLPRRSPLADSLAVDTLVDTSAITGLAEIPGLHLVLVDDAELIEEGGSLTVLLRDRRPDVRIVAAGAADALRALYGHWTHDVRRSRSGCALRPNPVVDGDLWHTPLPRRGPERFPTGRGYLLSDGQIELVQLGRN